MNKARQCLNCGSLEVGRFCQSCGQRQRDNHRSLGQFGYDFFDDFRTFDSKFWRTLFLLFLRPGRLTLEFNSGRRVRYLHPRQMYFFVSVIFFLLLSLLGGSDLFDLQRLLPHHQRDLLQTANDVAKAAGDVGENVGQRVQNGERKIESFRHDYLDYATDLEPGPVKSAPPHTFGLRARIDERFQTLRHMDRALLKERFVHRVSSNLPRVVFFVLPLFALLVLAFFNAPGRAYVDHLVFAFHVHIYFFIIAIVCLIYERITGEARAASLGLLVVLPYVFWSARRVYGRSLLATTLKLTGLLASYLLLLATSVSLLAAATLWFL